MMITSTTIRSITQHGACLASPDNSAAFEAAFAAADANGETVLIPAGVWRGKISMNGHRCAFRGEGDASVIKAPDGWTGAVVDFTGYQSPTNAQATRSFSDFVVEHDGTPGAAKKGIQLAGEPGGLNFRNISIKNTGGACLDVAGVQLSSFEHITLNTPVDAKANDIPYFVGRGACNGNRFIGLGFRSVSPNSDCGESGALRLIDDGQYAPEHNVFLGTWFEFLHPPENGRLIEVRGNSNGFLETQFFDCTPETMNGTRYVVFASPAAGIANYGANRWLGLVPGRDGWEYGIQLSQNGNLIQGPKGWNGYNVLIGAGVKLSSILLTGALSGATAPGVVDGSGEQNNLIIDAPGQLYVLPGIMRLPARETWDTPPAPPVKNVDLFSRVVGDKVQLCAIFPSGSIQIITTEP